MNSQFGKDPLSMMAGRVTADVQCSCDCGVRSALGEKHGHFHFPAGQAVTLLQVGRPTGSSVAAGRCSPANFLKLGPQGTHFVERGTELLNQLLTVSPKTAERRQKIGKAIRGDVRQLLCPNGWTLIPLHAILARILNAALTVGLPAAQPSLIVTRSVAG
jgi:hypothetical protein